MWCVDLSPQVMNLSKNRCYKNQDKCALRESRYCHMEECTLKFSLMISEIILSIKSYYFPWVCKRCTDTEKPCTVSPGVRLNYNCLNVFYLSHTGILFFWNAMWHFVCPILTKSISTTSYFVSSYGAPWLVFLTGVMGAPNTWYGINFFWIMCETSMTLPQRTANANAWLRYYYF